MLADLSAHTSCFLSHSENSANAGDKVSGWLEGSGLHLIIYGCECAEAPLNGGRGLVTFIILAED